MLALLHSMVLSQVGCSRRSTKVSDAKKVVSEELPSAEICPKAAGDDVQSDAETASTAEGDYDHSQDSCSSDDEESTKGVRRSILQKAAPGASDVLTRSELLAMAPHGPRRVGERNAACLPFAVPIASLGRNVPPALATQSAAPAGGGRRRGLTHPVHGQDVATGDGKRAAEQELERRVLAAGERLATPAAAAMPEVCALMEELQGLAMRFAQADEMLAQALAEAPAERSDAALWHKRALGTLRWSREELRGRQRAALLRLVDLAERAEGNAKDAASSPPCSAPPCHATRPAVSEDAELAPPPGLELPFKSSMTKDLESLRLCNPECILKVRKIKQLGWDSSSLLRSHGEQFGDVLEVYATPSVMKPNPKRPGGRVRPAAVGFIVMADADGLAAALAGGREQLVSGVTVEVSAFNPFLDSAE